LKKLLTIFLILIAINLQGQWLKNYVKSNLPSILCSFGAGLWSGQMDALQFHYCSIKREFPSINDQWFNPAISCENKYYNHIPPREAYPLSTTALVWTTDQWHFAQMQRDLLVACAIAFHLGEKQKWYYYFLDVIVYSASYLIGKNISYELLSIRK